MKKIMNLNCNELCKKCGSLNTTYKIKENKIIIICRRCNSIVNEYTIM